MDILLCFVGTGKTYSLFGRPTAADKKNRERDRRASGTSVGCAGGSMSSKKAKSYLDIEEKEEGGMMPLFYIVIIIMYVYLFVFFEYLGG